YLPLPTSARTITPISVRSLRQPTKAPGRASPDTRTKPSPSGGPSTSAVGGGRGNVGAAHEANGLTHATAIAVARTSPIRGRGRTRTTGDRSNDGASGPRS